MRVGVLAYHSACNYGANLQVLSTVGYLHRNGHQAFVINYEADDFVEYYKRKVSEETYEFYRTFREELMPLTRHCSTTKGIARIIEDSQIEAVIIGSDAVAQHHSLLERITFPSSRGITIHKVTSDRLFPNPFWGTFSFYLSKKIPMALMSASSQDSDYRLFLPSVRKRMYDCLRQFEYISNRDEWTQRMYQVVSNNQLYVNVTPDPVFSFNQNQKALIPAKSDLLRKFNLPENYYLLSFLNDNTVSANWLESFEQAAREKGISCVALPFPQGLKFSSNLEYKIPSPLSPVDWYALIKYSKGYIGHNMHPIVVSLHNVVPFYSFDNYGVSRYRGLYTNDSSSKIYDLLRKAALSDNRVSCIKYAYNPPKASDVLEKLLNFDLKKESLFADSYQKNYEVMMANIIHKFETFYR